MNKRLERSALVYNIHILLSLSFPFILSHQLKCDQRINCGRLQKGSQTDCCYLSAGDQCDDATNRLCDTEMGYSCDNGICSGKYNLTVSWIGDTTMNLSWSPFLPVGTRYNYTVLYSQVYNTDPLMFSSHLVDNRSNYSLKWLTPSTLYFVRVGIWTGNTYENLTEVVMARTKATDHCLYNGRRVTIGEQLVIDCEESCYCTPTGRFQCVPVCSKLEPGTPSCTVPGNREKCCDVVHHCSYDTCLYLGETVQHEYSWVINCDENCTCYDGAVTCVPHCSDVMIPDNCTNPVITKTSDGCCETYECHEKAYVCQYKKTSYKVDTWFQSTDCEICKCMPFGQISCINLSKCMTTSLPNQSELCPSPALTDSRCCNQIICEKQTDNSDVFSLFTMTKYSVSSALVRFQFASTKDEHDAVRMKLFYKTDKNSRNFTHWPSNVSVNFKDIVDASNKSMALRDFGKPFVLYKINRNYLLVIPELNSRTFYYIKLTIEFDKNLKAIHEYTTTTRAIQVGLHTNEANDQTWRLNTVTLNVVNMSSSSAFIIWSIPKRLLHNISSFVIKYKALRSVDWQYTERLIFSERNILITCLYSSSWYEAQLIAHPGGNRLTTTFFNTSSIREVSSPQFTVNIRNITIRPSSAIIRWQRLPESLAADVNNVEILWTRGNDYGTLLIACVTVDQEWYIIQDLESNSMYTVWLGVSRKDGTTTFTNRMHFVPLQQYSSSHSGNQHSIVFAVIGACLSLVAIVIAIATAVYLFRYKRRSSYQGQTSFENKIFQIYNTKDDREVQ